MDTNFSPELKKVLADSTKQALRHNVAVIQPEHLLMALISDSDSKGFRLIEKAATSSSAYALQQNLDKYLFEEALNTYGDASAAQVSVSDMSNRLIKLSVLEARMLRSDTVDSEHLLLALFHNADIQNLAYMDAFRNAGVTYDSLYSLLSNVADAPRMGAGFSGEDEDDDEAEQPFGPSKRPAAS